MITFKSYFFARANQPFLVVLFLTYLTLYYYYYNSTKSQFPLQSFPIGDSASQQEVEFYGGINTALSALGASTKKYCCLGDGVLPFFFGLSGGGGSGILSVQYLFQFSACLCELQMTQFWRSIFFGRMCWLIFRWWLISVPNRS